MSKKQITKKQHYVWRGYLKRWTQGGGTEDRIYTYRKIVRGKQPEFEHALLTNVGFEKYYYDMTGITGRDISVVSQLVNFGSPKNSGES